MSLPFGSSKHNELYRTPSKKRIVSQEEAKTILQNLLNARLNTLNDKMHMGRIRAELTVDVEKSFMPPEPLTSIVNYIVCANPDYHFQYDPRDDYVKFVKNGDSYLSMPILTDSSSMPHPSSSDLNVDAICDAINHRLKDAAMQGRIVSISRLAAAVDMHINPTDLLDFVATYIKTGDIQGKWKNGPESKFPALEYEENVEEMTVESLTGSVRDIDMNERRDEEERDEREDGGLSDDDGRESESRRCEDMEWDEPNEMNNRIESAEKLRRDLNRAFPHIRNLHYLIYLLQNVIFDARKDVLDVDTFRENLDDIVGGTFNYNLFGMCIFSELIYHRLLAVVHREVDSVKVQLNPLICEDNCKIELMRGYLAGQVYKCVAENGECTYREICQWIENKDSHYLEDEFPQWNRYGEEEKIAEVRGAYKSYHEIYLFENERLMLDPSFPALAVTPFLF